MDYLHKIEKFKYLISNSIIWEEISDSITLDVSILMIGGEL